MLFAVVDDLNKARVRLPGLEYECLQIDHVQLSSSDVQFEFPAKQLPSKVFFNTLGFFWTSMKHSKNITSIMKQEIF